MTFWTFAQLLPQDTNQVADIYVVDIDTGAMELLTVSMTGGGGNDDSRVYADLSADGRFVSFGSLASNLTPGILPLGYYHAYMRDRLLGQTRLASVSSTGSVGDCWGPTAISDDGRFVAFWSSTRLDPVLDHNALGDVYVHDFLTGGTELITVSPSGTGAPYVVIDPLDISADGRFVFFDSGISDLVPGDSNNKFDVFRRDRVNAVTTLISIGAGGQPGDDHSAAPQCSEDGRFVVFVSYAANLVPSDNNLVWDIFVRDTIAGTTVRVSVDSFGFESNGLSTHAAISPEGRFVVFRSRATNLVQGDTNNVDDDFLHDRVSGRTERVSVDNAGAEAYATSGWPVVSRDAGRIAFNSQAPLDPTDSNAAWDVYVRECPLPISYCTAKVNSLGCIPVMTSTGVPLASWPNGFVLGARSVFNQKVGMLMYSSSGAAAQPFHGGTLCVQQPVSRTPIQHSVGSTIGTDCTGSFALDFNIRVASGVDPSLVAGTQVWAQYWSRDPGFAPPDNASLTNAVTFVIRP